MSEIPMRLFGVFVFVVAVYLNYFNWQLIGSGQEYYTELAFTAPFFVVGGLFVAVFPAMSYKTDSRRTRVAICIMTAIGVCAGVLNWYLMSSRAGY